MAKRILMNEYKDLEKQPWLHIELIGDDILRWKVALIILNPDSVYYGAYFLAKMTFPSTYPYQPPDFKFTTPLFHPNVYPDTGRLCISILHAPGEDELSGESASIRWSPAQRVESILLSILSMLDDANPDSPANVDASKMYREDTQHYKEMAIKDRERSKQDIPPGFVMPGAEAYAYKKEEVVLDSIDDWGDSDAEFDFDSGSGSDDGGNESDVAGHESDDDEDEDA